MKKNLVTNREVAKHLDLTEQYVSKLKSDGILPGGRGRSGMDIDVARLNYINFLRTKGRMSPKGSDSNIAEEKKRLTKAQADKAEMEVELLNQGVLKSDEVQKGWIAFVSNIRAKLLNLASKVAHRVVGLETYGAVEEIINIEVYEILHELAKSKLPNSIRISLESNEQSVHASRKVKGK